MAAQYTSTASTPSTSRRSRWGCSTSSPRLGLHDGDARERELLWAACMLHDIGMSIDYDDHHKHSRYLILNGGLPGFTPVETAIIAQAARYHRKGMPAPGPMAALFGEGDAERLDRCAALLRLAEDLERSRDQLVRAHEHRAAATARSSCASIADGESAVPRWAAGRERELFARAFAPRALGRVSPPLELCLAAPGSRELVRAPGAVEQRRGRPGSRRGCATPDGAAGGRRAARRAWRVAAARRVRAAEHDVARFAARHKRARPRPVERGVGAAVAAERAGVEAQEDHRRGGVGGDRQQRPAAAGVVAST